MKARILICKYFTIQAVPGWGKIPYEWALGELVKAQPEDFSPETYIGYVNPYMFAGGKSRTVNNKTTTFKVRF